MPYLPELLNHLHQDIQYLGSFFSECGKRIIQRSPVNNSLNSTRDFINNHPHIFFLASQTVPFALSPNRVSAMSYGAGFTLSLGASLLNRLGIYNHQFEMIKTVGDETKYALSSIVVNLFLLKPIFANFTTGYAFGNYVGNLRFNKADNQNEQVEQI